MTLDRIQINKIGDLAYRLATLHYRAGACDANDDYKSPNIEEKIVVAQSALDDYLNSLLVETV